MDYEKLADTASVQKTAAALKELSNADVTVVKTKAEALEKIKILIPKGASVMNGSSRTLDEIGFVEYFKSESHGWNNLHAGILAETDPEKQMLLRKQSVISDYYLGSVHAVAETG